MFRIPIINIIILRNEEKSRWKSIVKKAGRGHLQWVVYMKEYENSHPGSQLFCPPWIDDLTREESQLIDDIHEKFWPGDYIVDPLPNSQGDYIWYDEVKNKVFLI